MTRSRTGKLPRSKKGTNHVIFGRFKRKDDEERDLDEALDELDDSQDDDVEVTDELDEADDSEDDLVRVGAAGRQPRLA